MKKVYDSTFKKGAHYDDIVYEHMQELERISHKPKESESHLVDNDVGDMSHYSVFDKKFRVVVYIEDLT